MQLIDFSADNNSKLTRLIDELGETLIKSGFGVYVDHLTKIRLASQQQDTEAFKKWVISPELFGGSGAICEIWIEDRSQRAEFNTQFCDFMDLLRKMGVKNKRIEQVRRRFSLIDEE